MRARRRGITRTAAGAASAAVLLSSSAALAFKPVGHDVIEATAYKRLLAMPAADDTGVSGKALLAALVQRHVLARPTCFPSKDETESGCERPATDVPGKWLPVVSSGREDLWLTRQFSGSEQCFHFMAPPSDVYGSTSQIGGVPLRLEASAPGRCLRFVNGLVDRIQLADPDAAYVLIHALVDSFSAAHAVRDDRTWALEYLKPWHVTAGPAYLVHWSGFAYWDGKYHHAVVDGFDDEWLKSGASCVVPDESAVYSVPESCLSDRALRAVDVVVHALEALYVMSGRGAPTHDAPEWQAVMEEVASRQLTKSERDAPRSDEALWSPNFLLGAGIEAFTSTRHTEALARFGVLVPEWFPPSQWFAPFVPLAAIDVGASHGDTSGFVLRAGPAFELPVTHGVSLRMPSLDFELLGKSPGFAATLAGVDLFPVDGYWIGLSAGRYSFATGGVDAAPLLSIGAALVDATDEPTGARRPPPGPETPAQLDAWKVPLADYGVPRARHFYRFTYGAELAFGPRGGSAGILGQELVWVIARSSGNPLLGLGVHGVLGGMQVDDTSYATARVAPVIRLWAAGAFGVESRPVAFVGGLPVRGSGRTFAAPVSTPLSVFASVGSFQLAVDGPSGEWSDFKGIGTTFRPARGSFLGLRLGAQTR